MRIKGFHTLQQMI